MSLLQELNEHGERVDLAVDGRRVAGVLADARNHLDSVHVVEELVLRHQTVNAFWNQRKQIRESARVRYSLGERISDILPNPMVIILKHLLSPNPFYLPFSHLYSLIVCECVVRLFVNKGERSTDSKGRKRQLME